ncbi:MAG TPA: hypothetical protein VNJ02_02740 [Vicinamibacterales bacterium]|nr:hypothetical protein [Vicinamibacterales bacterium]
MAIRNLVLSLGLVAIVLPSLTLANHEHRVTVLLRNGERVAGLLEDVENGAVYVRRGENDQAKLGVGNVALIDFVGGASGLPETELSVARGGNHVVLLRDGSSWSGQFIDVRGGEETAAQGETHMLHFRTTNGEERRIPLDSVARIYLGNFPGGSTTVNNNNNNNNPPPTSNEPIPAGAIRVPGNSTWVATALSVRRGDVVRFNATGRVQLSDDGEDVAHAAGSLRQRRANGSPLPANFAGALIGKVGNSAPFAIGDQSNAVTMPADGQLFLGVNDDEVGDNRGEFVVTLQHTPNRRRR